MAEATKTAAVKKEGTVKIKLPAERRGEENFIIASLNGKVYKIMRGVEVDVPVGIAKILQHAEEAEVEANKFMDKKAQ